MTKYVLLLIIIFNDWLDVQEKKGAGFVVAMGLILPAVITITYSEHWLLTTASVFFLISLFFVRFLWFVIAKDMIDYVKEHM